MSNLWLQPDVPERPAVHLVLLRAGADQGPPHERGTREPGQGQQGRPGGAVCPATGKEGGDQGPPYERGTKEPGQGQQGRPGGAVCTAKGKEGGDQGPPHESKEGVDQGLPTRRGSPPPFLYV